VFLQLAVSHLFRSHISVKDMKLKIRGTHDES
jgi:hypothetical protein